ncbi:MULTISPECIES: rubrerythrin-like domain-containing protein [Saliphagus]|uniref:Rubrerythrin-like domain-containing protein n=1 Tax=Saliphagus infecundisoli TaxID=1849069 RepID=A0ABD5QJ70_9EURY|nr:MULTISPECIES: rubrerythrin-like domain-containing protein [Saliphagus]
MVHQDPYTSDRSYYECRDCGSRATAERTPAACPDCGGRVRNIGVPRE